MKLKPDNSSLELEFEVDSNVSGQSWHVQIRQNGSRIFTGTRVTQGAERFVHRPPPSQRFDRYRQVRREGDEPVHR